jgi:hypothetical protein
VLQNMAFTESGGSLDSQSIEIIEGTETNYLNISLDDIQSMSLNDNGALTIILSSDQEDSNIIVINNFENLAQSNKNIILNDGREIDSAGVFENLKETAQQDVTETVVDLNEATVSPIEINQDEAYDLSVMNGNLEIANASTKLHIKDFASHIDAELTLALSGGDQGMSLSLKELIKSLKLAGPVPEEVIEILIDAESKEDESKEAEIREERPEPESQDLNPDEISQPATEALSAEEVVQGEEIIEEEEEATEGELANAEQAALDQIARNIAEIEPAAGEQNAASERGGFGFQSSVDSAPLGAPDAIGPIDPTALQYDVPEFQDPVYPDEEEEGPPDVPFTPPTISVQNGVDSVQVKEDGSVDILVDAALGEGTGEEILSVTIIGIDPSWGISFSVGVYDPGTGTWSATMPAGQNLSTVLNFSPPAESDIDLTGLLATAISVQPSTGESGSATDGFNIIVDAVADDPSITADGDTEVEGTAIDGRDSD